ncbi:MAG: response regulator transcription factor [Eubacterium sp.]
MKFLLVDDHCLFTTSLKIVLERFDEVEEVVVLNSINRLNYYLSSGDFSLLLLDIHIGDINGLEVGRNVKSRYPHIPLVFLTGFDLTEYKYQATQIGADGFFNKNIAPKDLFDALKQITCGTFDKKAHTPIAKTPLTKREKQILILTSQGHNHLDIAEKLTLSKRTVETQLHSIYRKLHVSTASAAVLEGVKLGIIPTLKGN